MHLLADGEPAPVIQLTEGLLAIVAPHPEVRGARFLTGVDGPQTLVVGKTEVGRANTHAGVNRTASVVSALQEIYSILARSIALPVLGSIGIKWEITINARLAILIFGNRFSKFPHYPIHFAPKEKRTRRKIKEGDYPEYSDNIHNKLL